MCEAPSKIHEGQVLGMYEVIDVKMFFLPGCPPFWELSLGMINGEWRSAFLTQRSGKRPLPEVGQWMLAMVLLTPKGSRESESLAEIGDYICI